MGPHSQSSWAACGPWAVGGTALENNFLKLFIKGQGVKPKQISKPVVKKRLLGETKMKANRLRFGCDRYLGT